MQEWINENILELRPYQPGKPLEEFKREFKIKKVVKLGSNENPFPVPQHVSDAIKREISSLRLYPDTDSFFLRKRIAELNGVRYSTIKFYAELGLLPYQQQGERLAKYYPAKEASKRLQEILKMRKQGKTIPEVIDSFIKK